MSFSEEHERLVAIETALGGLLVEILKISKDPSATRDSFAEGMRETAQAYPRSAMATNNADGIVRAFGIASAIEQLLGELLEPIRIDRSAAQ